MEPPTRVSGTSFPQDNARTIFHQQHLHAQQQAADSADPLAANAGWPRPDHKQQLTLACTSRRPQSQCTRGELQTMSSVTINHPHKSHTHTHTHTRGGRSRHQSPNEVRPALWGGPCTADPPHWSEVGGHSQSLQLIVLGVNPSH